MILPRSKAVCVAIATMAAVLTLAFEDNLSIGWKKLSDVKTGLKDFSAIYPVFGGKSPIAKAANTYFADEARKAMAMAREGMGDGRPPGDPRNYTYDMQSIVTVSVARTDIISCCTDSGFYFGGAHPNRTSRPATFAVVNGKVRKLTLNDLLKKKSDRETIKNMLVIPALHEQKRKNGGVLDWEFPDNAMDRFVVTPSGLSWIFEPYLVGPYVDGDFTIKIAYAELKPYLNPNGPLKSLLEG